MLRDGESDLAIHDPTNVMDNVRDGIERLLNQIVQAKHTSPGWILGRAYSRQILDERLFNKVLQRRQLCLDRISTIDGLEAEEPGGAFYIFLVDRSQMD